MLLKVGLLKKEKNIFVNSEFSNKRKRLNLIPKNFYDIRDDKKENINNNIDKKNILKCNIIRIMKMNKRILYNDLFIKTSELNENKFIIERDDFKIIIEELIDNEYIERDDDISYLKYIA